MEEQWAREFSECQNCGTRTLQHRGRGLCKKCYPIMRHLEEIRAWDLNDASTLGRYPFRHFHPGLAADRFARFRSACARQIEERLTRIANKRDRIEHADGIAIEFALNRIARTCGARTRKLFHGSATPIDNKFNVGQKRTILGWLDLIEDSVPWRGVNLDRALREAGTD